MRENPKDHSQSQVDLLVIRARDGDAGAFGEIYDLYIDRIYRHVYYRVGTREDAEDLTQQVFMNAWKAIGKYKITASPFLAWLMTISHNTIVNHYRAKKLDVYNEEIILKDPGNNPEKMAEMSYEQERLRDVILRLPEDQQRVVLMYFLEGFSHREIADSLGKTEGAVRVIQYRALKKIQGIMNAGRA